MVSTYGFAHTFGRVTLSCIPSTSPRCRGCRRCIPGFSAGSSCGFGCSGTVFSRLALLLALLLQFLLLGRGQRGGVLLAGLGSIGTGVVIGGSVGHRELSKGLCGSLRLGISHRDVCSGAQTQGRGVRQR